MSDKYILDGHVAVPEPDLMKWAAWFEKKDSRRVANITLGEARISTVFLGIDHSFGYGGRPLLFETMIFGGAYNEYQTRCETWEEAEEMHAKAIRVVQGKELPGEAL